MGFRDELGATKARAERLEEENARLRDALEESQEESRKKSQESKDEPAASLAPRTEPSAADFVGAAFVTLTAAAAFYAAMVWWLPSTQPGEDAQAAGIVGAAAAAGTSIMLLCPAVFGWTREEGKWQRLGMDKRWKAAAMGLGFLVFIALLFLFTDGDGV